MFLKSVRPSPRTMGMETLQKSLSSWDQSPATSQCKQCKQLVNTSVVHGLRLLIFFLTNAMTANFFNTFSSASWWRVVPWRNCSLRAMHPHYVSIVFQLNSFKAIVGRIASSLWRKKGCTFLFRIFLPSFHFFRPLDFFFLSLFRNCIFLPFL